MMQTRCRLFVAPLCMLLRAKTPMASVSQFFLSFGFWHFANLSHARALPPFFGQQARPRL
jgi:hypothetical protein